MDKIFQEKAKEFWGGSIMGMLAGGNRLLFGTTSSSHWIMEFFIKLLGTVAIAVCSGFATVVIVDMYKNWIKPKIYKEDKDDNKTDYPDPPETGE